MEPRSHSKTASRLRRAGLGLAIAAAAGGIAYRYALPRIVESRLRDTLAEHGFGNATLHVASVGIDHVRLTGVSLGEGLVLGDVELDAGLSLLWGATGHELSIDGGQLAARSLERLAHGGKSSSALPFDRLRLKDCAVALDDEQATVSGTLSLDGAKPLSVDLTASSEKWRVGAVALRDVVVRARTSDTGIRACVTTRIGSSNVEACSTLPSSREELAALRAADVTWSVGELAPGWSARGRGRVELANGKLALADGHAELEAATQPIATMILARPRIEAGITGSLSDLDFEVTGIARADRVELPHGTVARTASLPFAIHAAFADGALHWTPRRALLATATDMTIEVAGKPLRLGRPAITIREDRRPIVDTHLGWPRIMRWSAADARWSDARLHDVSGTLSMASGVVQWRAADARWAEARFAGSSGVVGFAPGRIQTVSWTGVDVAQVQLGAGELRFRTANGQLHLDFGHSTAIGGELSLEPVVADLRRPIDVVVHARGLDLQRVLRAVGQGHVAGTGSLDGDLAFRFDRTGSSLTSVKLHSRGGGGIQVNDDEWRKRASAGVSDFALQARIMVALSDFEYSHLTAVLGPRGADPELKVSTRGRGKRVRQDLDFTINLRGVRDAAQRVALRADP